MTSGPAFDAYTEPLALGDTVHGMDGRIARVTLVEPCRRGVVFKRGRALCGDMVWRASSGCWPILCLQHDFQGARHDGRCGLNGSTGRCAGWVISSSFLATPLPIPRSFGCRPLSPWSSRLLPQQSMALAAAVRPRA